MRILLVHNHYQQAGGEDSVFEAEGALLESNGHDVVRYTEHNNDVSQIGKLQLAARTIWSRETNRKLGEVVTRFKPEVVHFHNTLPLISPSAYYAAAKGGARIIQTLHNYRLFCPPSLFLRDGKVCELCLGKTLATPAIRYGCYRGSRSASTVVATMLATHKLLNTYFKKIDTFVALTEFSKSKFVEGGFPASKIVVKPHFIEAPEVKTPTAEDSVLFVGRLSEEKGIGTLLNSWIDSGSTRKLIIVGDGPMHSEVEAAVKKNDSIHWLGRKSADEVRTVMQAAGLVVVPSECYETFGRVIMEAYAVQKPVVVSRIGAVAELVDDGNTGLLFEPGNSTDLMKKVEQVFAGDTQQMARNALSYYTSRFTPEANYRQLMAIYAGDYHTSAAHSHEGSVRNVA
ncbi:MAG: glycosyltransferase family 4 protein [Rhodothermales bacterium]|nr:glycosyltransferase family 4 protein [Rhodothermales bacterium]